MFKKKNYKIILGVIVGIIISVTAVYAATYYGAASDLSYDNTTSGLSSSNVQDALDELYELKEKNSCPEGYLCIKYKTTASDLELGDYVSYTPTVASYSTDTTKTDYSVQTIYPSELNLWRVLNKNSDGSVDIISEYVSSTDVYFFGKTGYLNLVGYLNVLAKQYETEGITSGSRHFGYNGQTEYITDTSKFTSPAPWTSSTTDNSNEAQGGGDILYEKDYNQLLTALGTREAHKAGTGIKTNYWIASRFFIYYSSEEFGWRGRYMNEYGILNNHELFETEEDEFGDYNLEYQKINYALRPIVTLKPGLNYSGAGTKDNPVEIITS